MNFAGVQALLGREFPQAIYTHCMNHKLNLVIVATCRGIKTATDVFMTLQGPVSYTHLDVYKRQQHEHAKRTLYH